MLVRLLAIIVIAFAATAAAIDMTRRDAPAPSMPAAGRSAEPARPDPLRDALRRCQAMGEAAARDRECLDIWAENRRRFLGLTGRDGR